MAVVIETTLGDITIDLYTKERPKTCLNFLKLCKIKYYNYNLFHSVQHNFLAQTGDPTGSSHGGESIFGALYGSHFKYYAAEQLPKIKHTKTGLVSMVNCGGNMLGAQFFITLGTELTSLDSEHCVFGEVTEGNDVLLKLNETICDGTNRPYQDIRITHTIILEDPFDDPPNLKVPDRSPSPSAERLMNGRIDPDEAIDEMNGKTMEEIEEMVQEKEAAARATILEIVGDLPDAGMAPPENVLFVCKLNPVTSDDDLEIIFSRFGKINCCEVIRDKVTGDSLQYAFIEFAERKSCEEAYFKMANVLIDDRRIHVDFSQSVSMYKWRGKGRGVEVLEGRPGDKVESERIPNDRNGRQDKYHEKSSKQQRSPVSKNRNDDRRGSSRDIRRDYSRRNDSRRREERPRSRDRHRSRSPLNKSRSRNRESERSRHESRDNKSKNNNRPRSRDRSNKDRGRGSTRRSRDRNTVKEKPAKKEEKSEPQLSEQNHVNETLHSSVEKTKDVEKANIEVNGIKNDSQDSTDVTKEEKEKSVSSTSTLEKRETPKEMVNNKEMEVSSKKRPDDGKQSTQTESSSESSSEESSSSSSEPQKKKRKKSKIKKVVIIKKKGRSSKHKKRKIQSDTDTSSDDSSNSSSSDSESEPRKSKHKKRKKRTEIVRIISRKASHKKRKKRMETSSESSSESDVPRKKKKSKKIARKMKHKKDKKKRKRKSESESSCSEEPSSKRRNVSKKSSKKKQSSESDSSSA